MLRNHCKTFRKNVILLLNCIFGPKVQYLSNFPHKASFTATWITTALVSLLVALKTHFVMATSPINSHWLAPVFGDPWAWCSSQRFQRSSAKSPASAWSSSGPPEHSWSLWPETSGRWGRAEPRSHRPRAGRAASAGHCPCHPVTSSPVHQLWMWPCVAPPPAGSFWPCRQRSPQTVYGSWDGSQSTLTLLSPLERKTTTMKSMPHL